MNSALLAAAIPMIKQLIVDFDEAVESCPLWIFQLTGLTGLALNHYPFRTLPDEISALTELQHLHMYGSKLTKVPRCIECLKNLYELDLYTSYALHYLPYEVTRCSALADSRFSIRALFGNGKTNMALPLLPDWQAASQSGVGAGEVYALLQRCGCLSLEAETVMSFLDWNRCSVCKRWYLHDAGSYTWSHCHIGTDTQALLAFCCSARCAKQVKNQIRFDSRSGKNEALKPESSVSPLTEWRAMTSWGGRRAGQATRSTEPEGWSEAYEGVTAFHLLPLIQGRALYQSQLGARLSGAFSHPSLLGEDKFLAVMPAWPLTVELGEEGRGKWTRGVGAKRQTEDIEVTVGPNGAVRLAGLSSMMVLEGKLDGCGGLSGVVVDGSKGGWFALFPDQDRQPRTFWCCHKACLQSMERFADEASLQQHCDIAHPFRHAESEPEVDGTPAQILCDEPASTESDKSTRMTLRCEIS